MSRSRFSVVAVVALPPLLLALVGLAHPHDLTDGTAASWRNLHIALLPIFPLLGLAPWLVVRPHSRVLGWAAALLGYVYAVCYTALDVLAGIGAGALQAENGGSGTTVLFAQGGGLALYGEWAYVAAALLASALAIRRVGLIAVPGAALAVTGAFLFLDNHIYWPIGVLSMALLTLGWAALAWVTFGQPDASADATDGVHARGTAG